MYRFFRLDGRCFSHPKATQVDGVNVRDGSLQKMGCLSIEYLEKANETAQREAFFIHILTSHIRIRIRGMSPENRFATLNACKMYIVHCSIYDMQKKGDLIIRLSFFFQCPSCIHTWGTSRLFAYTATVSISRPPYQFSLAQLVRVDGKHHFGKFEYQLLFSYCFFQSV